METALATLSQLKIFTLSTSFGRGSSFESSARPGKETSAGSRRLGSFEIMGRAGFETKEWQRQKKN